MPETKCTSSCDRSQIHFRRGYSRCGRTLRAAGGGTGNPAGATDHSRQRVYWIDGITGKDDASVNRFVEKFFEKHVQRSELHPDVWRSIVVHDPAEIRMKLAEVAGDKYSYADLDDFSDLIARTVEGAPETSKVERRGLLPQAVYLQYSQRSAGGVWLAAGRSFKLLSARNIITTGGIFETGNDRSSESLRPIRKPKRDRRCCCRQDLQRCSGISAGSGQNYSRLPEPRELSELLHMAGHRPDIGAVVEP